MWNAHTLSPAPTAAPMRWPRRATRGGPQSSSRGLLLTDLLDRAARWFGTVPVISLLADGTTDTRTWADVRVRSLAASRALVAHGVRPGDRVATLALNSEAHLALWYAAAGCGAVLHTLNPRLHADDLAWIAQHGGDTMIAFDGDYLQLAASLRPRLPRVRAWIALTRDSHGAYVGDCAAWLDYETLIAAHALHASPPSPSAPLPPWPALPISDDAPAGLCYTSGTTGKPKGVMYSLIKLPPRPLRLARRCAKRDIKFSRVGRCAAVSRQQLGFSPRGTHGGGCPCVAGTTPGAPPWWRLW